MTHDTPPKRITREEAQAAVDPMLVAEILRDFGANFDKVYPVGVLARGVGPEQSMIGLAIKRGHLVTRSEAEAMVAAALRGAADLADTTFSGSGTDAAMIIRNAILASIPQPASAALDKLIAEAVNEAMLQCIGIVANLRNKRNPGPLFEVLNRAMSDIEDARFSAIREKNNG